MVDPGVVTVVTLSTIFGYLPAFSRVVTIASFAPQAVSAWPPEPPINTPLERVVTSTLKSRSTSAAPSIMVSSRLATVPRFHGLAYSDADMP
jgi:hypothetical protein